MVRELLSRMEGKGFMVRAAVLICLFTAVMSRPAVAGVITYISPSAASDSNVTWPSGTSYTNNLGIAFTTGSSGSFDIDWINLGLSTAGVTTGTASLKVALHAATNSTAYSAVAAPTAYATDTVSFSMPTTASTFFAVQLTSSDLANISNYSLQPGTSYALILYAPSANIGLQRKSGYANQTTNNAYNVTNGFTMLDTFKNNVANYSTSSSSYPSLDISFGANSSSVPEPSVVGIGMLLAGGGLIRRIRKRFRRGHEEVVA